MRRVIGIVRFRGNAGEVVHLVAERFEQPLFAAITDIALLDIGAEVQLLPPYGIGRSIGVIGLEVVTVLEIDLPRVLAHREAPDTAARAVVDAVIDDAVEDEGSGKGVIAAGVTVGIGAGDVLRVVVVERIGDELNDWDGGQRGATERSDLSGGAGGARLRRGAVGGDAGVDVIGEGWGRGRRGRGR